MYITYFLIKFRNNKTDKSLFVLIDIHGGMKSFSRSKSARGGSAKARHTHTTHVIYFEELMELFRLFFPVISTIFPLLCSTHVWRCKHKTQALRMLPETFVRQRYQKRNEKQLISRDIAMCSVRYLKNFTALAVYSKPMTQHLHSEYDIIGFSWNRSIHSTNSSLSTSNNK